MSIKERLKKVIEYKGLNLKTFSEITKIPYRSIQNYLRSEREPNLEALTKIGVNTDVNLHWLITGEGEMFNSSIKPDSLNENESDLLNHYRLLSDDTQKAFDVSFKILSEISK